MLSINTDVSTLTALRTLRTNNKGLASSLQKLATGQRINSGKDDPAGLITSENLRSVLAALDAETRKLERADQVIATADSALGEISGMLIEAEGLVVANANSAGMSDAEREANQMEIDSIMSTVNRLAGSTQFNGDKLLDGSATLSAGGETLTIDSVSMGAIGEGEAAQTALKAARDNINTMRGELGSFSKNTINAQINSLSVAIENTAAAESLIRDTDFGKETANLARQKLLGNASILALGMSQANSRNVLSLLA